MTVTDIISSLSHEAASGDRVRLQQSLDSLLAVWESHFPASQDVLEDDLESASDRDLLQLLDAVAAHQRHTNAALAVIAREVGARSKPMLGSERLTVRYGYRSADHLIAERTHIEPREAKTLVKVGTAIIGERGLTGARVPALTEHVAVGVRDGAIGLAHANEIVGLVQRLTPRGHVDRGELVDGEQSLVATAESGMPLSDFRKVITHLEAHLDPDGVEPSIEKQRAKRGLSFRTDSDSGMVYLRGKFDVESAAYIRHAIESYTTGVLRTSRGNNLPDEELRFAEVGSASLASSESSAAVPAGAVTPESVPGSSSGVQFRPTEEPTPYRLDQVHFEQRSIPQIQADALVDFAKHILGCDHSKLPGASTSVVVRIDSQDLLSEHSHVDAHDHAYTHDHDHSHAHAHPASATGVASIDGGTVVDLTTARRLAAAAGIIPMVCGSDGVVLDLGREARHFNRYQRLALIERDGGCAFCGLPPGMTEAHHRRWWTSEHGETDLDNGILLCTSCHHRVHAGWEIEIAHAPGQRLAAKKRGGTVWFIPPASVDPEREPRLGGRKRFDIAYRNANPPVPIRGSERTSWISLEERLRE